MLPWDLYALVLFSAVASLSHALVVNSPAGLGERCQFRDGALGLCEDMLDCRATGGIYRRLDSIMRCDLQGATKSLRVCCRKPQLLANKLCDAWTPYWARSSQEEGKSCVVEHSLIHGGEEAALGEFPHMAALGVMYEEGGDINWDCGGSLITPLFVLTAAHCVRSYLKMFVRLGEHDLHSYTAARWTKSLLDESWPVGLAGLDQIQAQTETDSTVEQTIAVNQSFTYPDYQRTYHDIALLKLDKPAVLTSRVLPACLPRNSREEFTTNTLFTVAGWGARYYGDRIADNYSGSGRKLQKVQVSNVESTLCWLMFSTTQQNLPLGITTDMICAGAVDKDSCQGDSGGPLMVDRRMSCEPRQVTGIVSFGPPCKDIGSYTRVSHYLDWIMAIIAPGSLP